MKKFSYTGLLFILTTILSGCSSHDTDGLFYNTFTKNMDSFLSYLYSLVNSWGVAVIIITLIVKGVILPFMLRSYKKQRKSSINMEKAKPELDKIQEKIKKLREDEKRTLNSDEILKLRMSLAQSQKEIFAIYKKYDCAPSISGNLLPILVQAPFVTALYFTLQNPIYSKEIINSSFFGIALGEKSFIILILVFLVYTVVSKLSQSMMQSNSMINTPEAEKIANYSKNMMWITPIMLTFLTYTNIAAIGIYFIVSGLIVILQVTLGRKLYPPYIPEANKEQQTKIKLVKR